MLFNAGIGFGLNILIFSLLKDTNAFIYLPFQSKSLDDNIFQHDSKCLHKNIKMSGVDDLDSSFQPKFDNQLIYGLEVDDNGNVQTTLENIQMKSGIDMSNLDNENDNNDKKNDSIQAINEPSSTQNKPEYIRERSKLNRVPIISRQVPLQVSLSSSSSSSELTSIIWEMEKPSDLVETWMTSSPSQKENVIRDPFGVVMWPGSILASQEMHSFNVSGKTVLILGAGTGVEAQAAALLGAKKVIATDVNRFVLKLLKFGVEKMGLDHIVEGRGMFFFDAQT